MAAVDFTRLGPPKGTRIAVVGACGGIGRALVEASVGIGLEIAALDLSSSLDEFPPPTGVKLAVALDATNEAQVESAFARVGRAFGARLDGLVNLAGFPNRHVPFHELSLAEWQETVDGSLKTTYLCCTGGTGRPADSPNANPRVDYQNYARLVPLGRVAEPADMVGPILFLLGLASGWVNGQVLHVNGGGLMP